MTSAAEISRIKTELLSLVKAQSCSLNPRALNLFIRAGAIIPAGENRTSFLRSAIAASQLSNREIVEEAARNSVSSLIPTLQRENFLVGSQLAEMQSIASGTSSGAAGQQQQQSSATQQTRNNAAAAAAAVALVNANFRAVALEEMPAVSIDESTCASFRVSAAPKSAEIKRIAENAERDRNPGSTGGGQPSSQISVAAALAGISSTAGALAATIDRRTEPSARTRALRTRIAIATGRVLRSSLYAANSLLGGGVTGARGLVSSSAEDAAAAFSAKHTVYRISALDGIRLSQPITLVGLLRFAPWLVPEAVVAAAAGNNASTSAAASTRMTATMPSSSSRTGWLIEDFSGQLPLLLPNDADSLLSICSNAFIGDGSVVVVHGLWAGNCLRTTRISLPPGETRAHVQSAVGANDDYFGLRPVDLYAASRILSDNAGKNVAILVSDIKLNVPANAHSLLRVMKEFEGRSAEVELAKVTFILVGDFVAATADSSSSSASASSSSSVELTTPWFNASPAALDTSFLSRSGGASDGSRSHTTLNVSETLSSLGKETIQKNDAATPASLLTLALKTFVGLLAQECPQVAAQCEFMLVPGPNDCCGSPIGSYPRAPLHSGAVAAFREKCPRTVATTNPARLRLHTQEFVVCRAPLHRTFAASALATIEGKSVDTRRQREEQEAELKRQQQQQQHQKRRVVHSVGDNDNNDHGEDTAAADASAREKRSAFADLAEAVVRGGFWFPVPSEGVLAASSSATPSAKQTIASGPAAGKAGGNAAAAATNSANQAQQYQHQPALLRSWGNIRWPLDRALFHGGAPHPPHVSLMCDDTESWKCPVDDVMCANTGSFSQTGVFAWISPADRTVDFNALGKEE